MRTQRPQRTLPWPPDDRRTRRKKRRAASELMIAALLGLVTTWGVAYISFTEDRTLGAIVFVLLGLVVAGKLALDARDARRRYRTRRP